MCQTTLDFSQCVCVCVGGGGGDESNKGGYRLLVDFYIHFIINVVITIHAPETCDVLLMHSESAKDACKDSKEDSQCLKQNDLTGERPPYGEGMFHNIILSL